MKNVALFPLTILLSAGLMACNPAPQTTSSTSSTTTSTTSAVTSTATASAAASEAVASASASAASSATATASSEATQNVLTVTATTSIIADLVRAVGGDRVTVQELVPAGSDAHTFTPSPDSVRTLSGSGALFANGAGLEGWLSQVTAAAPEVPVVMLTEGLPLHKADEEGHDHADDQAGDHADEHTAETSVTASATASEAEHEGEHAGHDHGEFDPHAWWDVDLASGYLDGIVAKLSELDPAGADTYRQNAAAYAAELRSIDEYGKQQFAAIPPEQRVVVTAHDALNYFAERYGLEVVGAVIPGLSTEREPSAQELATLAETMREHGVRVILTENVTSDRLAQALAKETGAVVAPPIYTDALGPAGSPGETFTGAFRHNIDSVVSALQQASAQP